MPIKDLIQEHLGANRGAQARMAEACSVQSSAVTRWASGESIPEEWRSDALAEVLGLEPDYVLACIASSRKQRQETKSRHTNEVSQLRREVEELRQAVERLQRRPGNRPNGRL